MCKFIFLFLLINIVFGQNAYLPDDVLDNFAEYVQLEDFRNTCSIEKQIAQYDEFKLKEYILKEKCIPDLKSFNLILQEGWQNLINFIVQEIYLSNMIDPSQPLYVYFNKNKSTIKVINNLVTDFTLMKNLSLIYSFEEKSEDKVNIKANVPFYNYVPLYTNIFCFKDMLIISAIFKNKQKQLFRIHETKILYDLISNKECTFVYNYFTNSFEISFQKENKFKVWENLFKSQ